MALTLFSRCEGATLDGTHDYSAGDTTWSLNSAAAFNTSGVKVGTNGLNCASSDDYAELSSSSIVDRTAGTLAFWFRIGTWADTTWIANLQGTAYNDRINIELYGADELVFRHVANGDHNVILVTTAANLTTGNWYFVQAHWSSSAGDIRLEVYDSSGSLIQAVENLSAGVGVAPADIIAIRMGTQNTSGTVDIDNVFIGTAYADDFLASRDITSYTEYGGAAALPKSLGMLLRGCG